MSINKFVLAADVHMCNILLVY